MRKSPDCSSCLRLFSHRSTAMSVSKDRQAPSAKYSRQKRKMSIFKSIGPADHEAHHFSQRRLYPTPTCILGVLLVKRVLPSNIKACLSSITSTFHWHSYVLFFLLQCVSCSIAAVVLGLACCLGWAALTAYPSGLLVKQALNLRAVAPEITNAKP